MRTIKRDIVAVLVYSKDKKLLMGEKDPKGGGVYSDCWHTPGGGIEQGETKEQAVIREVKEEVGIDVTPYAIEFVTDEDNGTAEKTLKDTGEKVLVEMQFYVYKIVISDKISNEIKMKFSDDLVEARWFDISELSTVKLTPPSEKYFKKIGYIA
jgi:8-oxo-dGTP pyrophosphatase MutT (NUDIX family)